MNLRVTYRRPFQLLMLYNDELFLVETIIIKKALGDVENETNVKINLNN